MPQPGAQDKRAFGALHISRERLGYPCMIRLLSTDFDGTLVDHDARPPVQPLLFETLAELQRRGVLWAVNTGRDLAFILHGLSEYAFPMEPDFILTNEREVFHRNESGQWQDYGDWNRRCNQAHDLLFQEEALLVENVRRYLEASGHSRAIYEEGRFVGVVSRDDAAMDEVVEFLHGSRAPESLFHYQRNTIFLRFCHLHYSKGAALGELGRLTGISAGETFAAGDHYNDLSMLDGEYARWPAAPANAIAPVREQVLAAGGYVATQRCSAGVVEALHYFFDTHRLAPPGFTPARPSPVR